MGNLFLKLYAHRFGRWILVAVAGWGVGGLPLLPPGPAEAALISNGTYAVIADQSWVSAFVRSTLHNFDTVAKKFDGRLIVSSAKGSRPIRIRLAFSTAAMVTGNALRDSLLHHKTMEVEKHPQATFVSRNVVFLGENGESARYKITGMFSLHGVTKKITVPVFVRREKETLSVKARFSLLLSDYKLSPPSILFIRVEDRVDVTIHFVLRKEKVFAHTDSG